MATDIDRSMVRLKVSVALAVLACLCDHSAAADEAAAGAGSRSAPEALRGWKTPPRAPSGTPVVSQLGYGLRKTAHFLVAVVAAPVRGAVYLEDHYHVYSEVEDILYNDARTAGVLPSLSFSSGFGVKLGATAFHSDLFGHRERVAVSAGYGGPDRYSTQLQLALPALLGGRGYARFVGRFEEDDRQFFQGIGNGSDPADPLRPAQETRFGEERTLAAASAGAHLGSDRARLGLGLSLIYNDRRFDQEVAAGETPIGDVYDVTALPGFADGSASTELSLDVELDLRDREGQPGHGARVSGFVGPRSSAGAEHVHYGLEAAYYLSPWRQRRVFVLRAAHEGVSEHDISFVDLPRIGGAGSLRGFRTNRFRDDLATIGTLEYRYPIHNVISGALFVETGKVARSYDELFGADDWHVGYGGGLVVHTRNHLVFTAEVAYGDGWELYLTTDVLRAFRKREKRL